VLDLTGPARGHDLGGHIGAWADPDWTYAVEDMAPGGRGAGNFRIYPGYIPDFGYTHSKIWLRLCLRNDTPETTDWRLYAHENFFQVYEVHVVRGDGAIEELMALARDSPFSDRPVADPEMIAPFTMEPGESVEILISYWSGGSSQVDLSVETAESYAAIAANKTARNFFFYGMMILLITVALVCLAVFRHPVFLAYAAYATSALLFVMHVDGVAFQYLWPWFPAFNSDATIFTGSGLIVFGAVYARVFLRTRERHPRMDKVLIAIIVVTLTLGVVLFIPNPQLLKKLLIMISLLAFLVFTAAGLIAYFSGYREVRFYLFAWLGVVLSSTLMNMRHMIGLEIPQEVVHDSMRAVMVLDALMMGLAIADRYNQMRLSRQAAMQETLTAAQHQLELNRRLAELQAQHELAVELSKSRDRQIQNVVHDLRQPLHALRMNVMSLNAGRQDAPSVGNIETTFAYLENLVARHLDSDVSLPAPAPEETDALDDLGVQQVLSAIEEMFAPDAEAKGLQLRRVESELETSADALALTRIVSNLVSNAIKYTETGGVLIGTRKKSGTVRIEVHDTGPGMSEADFARASQRSVRLGRDGNVQGKGLGLTIAIELARRNGMSLELSRLRSCGTGLVLVIPCKGAPRRLS